MKGVSAIIVTILLLTISVSLASSAYIFFGNAVSETTEIGDNVAEQTSTSLLSKIKIDSIEGNIVSVKNTGKVNVTQFAVFINEVLDSGATPSTDPLAPGKAATITLSSSLNPGDVVKVTTGQGAISIKSMPGVSSCTPDGCNGVCPSGCSTPADDPDCGCIDGDGICCAAAGCNSGNDDDCIAPCVDDGNPCLTGSQCCNGICENGLCNNICDSCGAPCSDGTYQFDDGTHTCDGNVNDGCNTLNGVWNTCTQTGDSRDADCDENCQAGLSYCYSDGNPPFIWGRCVDLQNDDCSCGTCGNDCTASSQVCQNGVCVSTGGGIVGFWNFDGDANDISGNDNHGIISGASFTSVSISGQALYFGGDPDYVGVSDDDSLDMTDEITVMSWVKPNDLTGTGYLVAKNYGYNQEMSYAIYFLTNEAIEVDLENSAWSTGYTLPIGKWTHVAVTWNGTHAVLYINGSYVSSNPMSSTLTPNNYRLCIGCRNDNGGPGALYELDGTLDELKIYDIALDATEINDEYQSYISGWSIGFWKFDGNAIDSSSSGIDGTVSGAIFSSDSVSGQSLDFDGSNDYVNLGDNYDTMSEGSIVWWAKFDSTTTPSTQRFWGKEDNYEVRWDGTTINFDMGGAGALSHPISFTAGSWYHMAFVWNSSGSYLFVNGTLSATGSTFTLPNTGSELHIGEGGYGRGTNNFNGKIDEFKIYDMALSETEIWQDYIYNA